MRLSRLSYSIIILALVGICYVLYRQASFVELIGLTISIVSLAVAILTYLRVTRQYLSKTIHFQTEINPKIEKVLSNIQGIGVFKKLEMTAKGSMYSMITLSLDGEVCLRESFQSLSLRSSRYITKFIRLNPLSPNGEFAIEVDLQRNFFRNLVLTIFNVAEPPMQINGSLHYDIYET